MTTPPLSSGPPQGTRFRELRIWLACAVLLAPVWVFYTSHYVLGATTGALVDVQGEMHPTGFVVYDMAYYMANAREHFDAGQFSLTYGNPHSPNPDTPRIYFQPQTLLLAFALAVFRIDPGLLFVSFGVVSSLAATRVAIAFFDHLFSLNTTASKLTVVCLIWSGGLLVATGAIWSVIQGRPVAARALFEFDPFFGWWFLNYGRNLVLPTEAYYHAIALGSILLLLRKRYASALACLGLLSISHPFSGTQFILVVICWLLFERFFMQDREIPTWTLVVIFLIAVLHFGYYLAFLPSHEEHAVLMRQWTLEWTLKAKHMVPAYGLVGLLAAWRMRNLPLAARTLAAPANRLLILWLLVSFGLANHEFAITPRQPLHFTRGHIWTPLFLLGAPTLMTIFERILVWKRLGALLCGILIAILLLDNVTFFAVQSRKHPQGIFVSDDMQLTLRYLEGMPGGSRLVIPHSGLTGYFVTIYTKHRAWHSHAHNTPHVAQRRREVSDFFRTNDVPNEWDGTAILIVAEKGTEQYSRLNDLGERLPHRFRTLYENGTYSVVQRKPRKP